jgi:hypothetical protein
MLTTRSSQAILEDLEQEFNALAKTMQEARVRKWREMSLNFFSREEEGGESLFIGLWAVQEFDRPLKS